MKILVVTLQYHYFIPSIKSHVLALKQLDDAGYEYHWHWDATTPTLNPQAALVRGKNEGHDIVTEKYRQLQRDLFLPGNYDVFIALEDDMIVPPDALVKLMSHIESGVDVAYGLYVWRRGRYLWSAYSEVDENRGRSLIQSDKKLALSALEHGQTLPVAGVGMGCTAIARHCLESIVFQRRDHACNDWYFAVDAQERGYQSVCDFSIVCGHMTVEPTPCVLYPSPIAPEYYRKEGL